MTFGRRTGPFIYCFITLSAFCLTNIQLSDGLEDVNKLPLYDCKKVMGRIAKKSIKTFGICTKEVKVNSTKEDFDKKMSCIIKCSLDKAKLLTEEGLVTKETIQNFMQDIFMNEKGSVEMGNVLIENCVKKYGNKLDKNQPFCESYGEFAQCMQNVIGDFADKANCNLGDMG